MFDVGQWHTPTRGRVTAAKAERPLSVQSRDLRGDVGQRARCAESRLRERARLTTTATPTAALRSPQEFVENGLQCLRQKA
jgi:hypothetical protein